jgi:branched-chain amino acid transport system substrate-binding protein
MRNAALFTVLLLLVCSATCRVEAADKEPIFVGALLPLSGALADFGKSAQHGVALAIEQVNEAGGVNGSQLKLKLYDSRSDMDRVEEGAKKLINEDKVCAAVGEIASSFTIRAGKVFKEAKIPLITPTSTNDAVNMGNDWVFRACFTDGHQGRACAVYGRKRLQKEKAAILTEKESSYSLALATVFKKKFEELKGKVVAEQSYTVGTTDLSTTVSALGDLEKIDLVFAPVDYEDAARIAKELRRQGYAGAILGADGWECAKLVELGGADIEGGRWSGHFNPDAEEAKSFVAAYRKKFDSDPDSIAALAYEAVMMLKKAIEIAKGTEPKALAAALGTLKEYKGVTGTFSMDQTRTPVKSVYFFKVENKAITFDRELKPKDIDDAK